MAENIKIYATDEYWRHIFVDIGVTVTDSPKTADAIFDPSDVDLPVSIPQLKSIIFNLMDNHDIIHDVFGKYVVLPGLQHKIVIALYKNPNISINELKEIVGVLPNMTTHTVENAIYQLRKTYGHAISFFINTPSSKMRIVFILVSFLLYSL